MGNGASCYPTIIINWTTKVLRWDGNLDVYARPVSAAKLMLDNPGQFVCHSSTLQVGHRITGLLADDELECRQLYFLLPMDMLYSVLTHEEVTHLNHKAHKASKFVSFQNLGKIFPVFGESCLFPSEAKRLEANSPAQTTQPDPCDRVASHRPWRPALETIVEAS